MAIFDGSNVHIEDGLCRLCRGIKFEQLRQGRVYEYETSYVQISGSRGCQLCTLIARCPVRGGDVSEPIVAWGSKKRLRNECYSFANGRSPIQSLVVSRRHGSDVDPALAL